MTTETTTTLRDDLSGEPDATTIVYALDRHLYAIDLSEANAEKFRALLAQYIEVSTVIGPIRTQPGRMRTKAEAAITGRPVPSAGRIQGAMSDVYQ
ncbi:Lsr2 dimerization domain-containing protein [Glycomyces sp. MUSA5-2]|uniref:Lsr2 dimerization domain-containing protein n=1 Tax=Glycomyces sp. MUSA5-2 TaxID=2053002 RepID=UPI00300B6AA6